MERLIENSSSMDINIISTVEAGRAFKTFAEARATIEQYAAQTNAVIILGKTTKNSNNDGYRQALFVCEKQGKYSGKNDEYTTKRTGCPFAIGINYRKRANEFVITKSCLEHNHDVFLHATKFSTVMRKLDKDDLGLVEKLYDNGLRTKDIFSVLNSVSSKYIHKPDVYNAVSRQRKRKLQGLTEIELLLKTLRDDKSIVGNVALQDAYNDERDQDGAFIQAIFWAYRNSIAEFSVGKDVLIIDATYKTNRFSMPLVAICGIDRFGSTYPLAFSLVYSETQDSYSWVLQQLNKVLIVFAGDAQVKTIITDRELALMKAISNIFPSTKHQLCTWHIFKNIKSKLRKDVDIDEFVKAVQKLAYGDFSESQIEQEIDMLWKTFPSAKTYMCETRMPYRKSWLAPYTQSNINLDIKSNQRVESLHSKLKGVENRVVPVDRMFTILWKQMKEHLQKLAYETFIHQNKHSHDKSDTGLEQLKLVCSRYAYESFIKQQGDLAKSGDYEVFETDNCVYNIMRIDDTSQIHVIHLGTPSACTCIHPQRTRTPCRHIIAIYLSHLHTHVPQSEIHQRWNVYHHTEMEHTVHSHVTQIFKQLPKYHHGAFSNLMQQASEYVMEHRKMPELLQGDQNTIQQLIFETINIQNIANDNRIKMPIIKRGRGRPPNNKRIRSADENKKHNSPLKKTRIGQKSKVSINNAETCNNDNIEVLKIKRARGRPPKESALKQKLDDNDNDIVTAHPSSICANPYIPQDTISQIHNPIGDGHCGFRSLAIAIFKEEKKWQDVKIAMRKYLNKQEEMYDNILGYDIKRLTAVLSYLEPECPHDYWFYTPECAQLASDTFNIPVVAFGADPTSSMLFLPFDKKPGRRKKPIILQWHGHHHITLVELKQNKSIQLPPLNPQYKPICHRLNFPEDWLTFIS